MAVFSDDKLVGFGCACARSKCSDECSTYRSFKPNPQTNYDCLISKTPEELAKTIVGWLADAAELCGENRQEFDLAQAEEYTVSWLKAPAEEEK